MTNRRFSLLIQSALESVKISFYNTSGRPQYSVSQVEEANYFRTWGSEQLFDIQSDNFALSSISIYVLQDLAKAKWVMYHLGSHE